MCRALRNISHLALDLLLRVCTLLRLCRDNVGVGLDVTSAVAEDATAAESRLIESELHGLRRVCGAATRDGTLCECARRHCGRESDGEELHFG